MSTATSSSDVVIVGSGPGGATVARQLARAGRQVTLLERGRDWRSHPLYGTYLGAMLYTDKASFLSTQEGLTIIRPLMLGGATSMYCGCAARPLPWWKERYGIDLNGFAEETISELQIAPLPPELRGVASTRLAEAAAEVGQTWQPQDKFMSPGRAASFNCTAKCMLGCRCGAKWNAAEYVDEAVAAGGELWTQTTVQRVLVQDGQVTGVEGTRGGRPFTLTANVVVLAAGGLGTPAILRNSSHGEAYTFYHENPRPSAPSASHPRLSGLSEAGRGLTMDTTAMVYGHAPYRGIGYEPPMTWSYADDELGAMFSTLIDPWLNYPIAMLRKGPAYPLTWYRWGRTLGVMIKLKDEVSGGLNEDGRISKGLTTADRQRLAQAEQVARQILLKAGCQPDSIFLTPLRGTHPSGTVRIGEMLSADLETEIKNLYVCDASVFPEALARPTVLTIIALAKRLALHLGRGWIIGQDLQD
ncbi:MAG: GMC family oxidoreductase [Chloroflexota bacterium]